MEKGKTSNGQIAKYRKLATQYREMANEAKGSIATYKGTLDRLNKELATFNGKDMSVDAEREKRDAVKSQIAANNDVLKGLSSKYKNADAIARRYEAMCGIDSPETVEVENIAAVEEGASTVSAPVAEAPVQETKVEEAAPVSAAAEAPVKEEPVVEKPVEAKTASAAESASSKKMNLLWALIPLMLLSMLVGGALLRADKPRYYTSDIAVTPAVTATATAATAAPKGETATVKVEAEKTQTSEAPVVEVEKKAEKVEEVASQGVSVDANASAIEKAPVEPETVAAVPAKPAEKPIAMFFGVSDAETEQKYRAEGYDVVVLPPVVEEVVAAPAPVVEAVEVVEVVAEPVVETVEVAVEVEPVVEVVSEPEVVEVVVEAVEEPAAPVYEHHVECYGYSADIVASEGVACVTYPEFVTTQEIYDMAAAAAYAYGDAVKDVYVQVKQPGLFEMTYQVSYTEADIEFAFATIDRDLPYYIASLFPTQAEAEPVAETVEVAVEVAAEPVVETVEVVVEEPAAPVYEHHVECYGYSADIVASEGVACVTYPEFVTTQEIYDMAAAASYAYGDAVKDVYVEVKEPGMFEMTYPVSYTEADIEYVFATIDRDLPIYIASLFAAQAEEPVVEEVVEVVAEPEVVEAIAEPAAPVYEHHVECYGYGADIVASEGVACVTYPAFVTTQEIYDMVAAAANAYGDAVKDVYVEVKEPGMFEMTYPVSYTEADIEYVFATIDRDLPIYIASLFAAQAEEPVVEETVEVSVEAVEEPATEEVVEVTVEVEEVSETVPVEVEISVEPAPEPVEIEIETIPAFEVVEVEVEKAETSEPVAIAVETKAPKAEAKDLFKSCSFSSGIVPYSYQKLYTEDTSLITGVGFKASAFKYFKSHYVALGLEYTGITHQYETKSFSDQKGLLKFRTYIPFNKSGESMMFVSSGIGGALITENNGQTKLFGLVAADLGVSFRLADDLALEISTNAVAAFRRYLRSIEVDAAVAMTYHF